MATRLLTSKITFADVRRAVSGDSPALESVVKAVLHDTYGLALRFLWHPEDAEDATQEIAIRIVTGLAGFDSRSRFRTWVYRIACNTLLTLAKKRVEASGISFESMSEDLRSGVEDVVESDAPSPYDAALVEEVKIGCTHAMLICLDRDHRLAYILGTVLDIDHVEAAQAMEITPSAFRKRLSRANARISGFVLGHCGLADGQNACRCETKVPKAVACGRVSPTALKFSKQPVNHRELEQVTLFVRRLESARRAAEIYRSHPEFNFSTENLNWVVELFSPSSQGDAFGAEIAPRPN